LYKKNSGNSVTSPVSHLRFMHSNSFWTVRNADGAEPVHPANSLFSQNHSADAKWRYEDVILLVRKMWNWPHWGVRF